MAHLVEQMAYVGDTPWHGLGQQLSPQQPLEVWQQQAGMNWHIEETPVRFIAVAPSHRNQSKLMSTSVLLIVVFILPDSYRRWSC